MRDAVAIAPIKLKLAKRTFETVRLGGVFGALRDAGPGYLGRRIIEKHRFFCCAFRPGSGAIVSEV